VVSAIFASVDINNADAESFASLNGIGKKKAESIVTYRNANGCFSNIEELSLVKGIGSKIVEKNKENLVLGKCKK
jgi:competence protein ComEA